MIEVFAGLDVSTQGCKLVVVDLADRTIVHVDALNYDHDLPQYDTENGTRKGVAEGVSESDPRMWVAAIHRLFEGLHEADPALPGRVAAISVSGQQHGLVTLTAGGELARPYAKLWNDFSTREECDLLTRAVGGEAAMIQAIGNTQRPGYTAGKIFHMVRHEPEAYARTRWVLLVHNYINWVLTGGPEGGVVAMEPGDASGTALWDPVSRDWARVVVDAIAPDLHGKLPAVRPSRDLLGPIGAAFVDKYGFAETCQVAAGSGDNMMGALGTGNFHPGIVTVSLGTSGTAYSFVEVPYIDPAGEIACFCDATGNYLPLLCISNMANGYDAILREFDLTHADFERLVRETPPGNGGRVLCPWYEGERTPDLPDAAPVYFGFKLADFTPAILARAVLEGHVFNLFQGFQKLPVQPAEIRLTGGMSKSPAWRETIANVFNCAVIPVLGEGAALGAALHAAWATKREASLTDLARGLVTIDEAGRVEPDPDRVAVYEQFGALFQAVSHRVRGVDARDPFQARRAFLDGT